MKCKTGSIPLDWAQLLPYTWFSIRLSSFECNNKYSWPTCTTCALQLMSSLWFRGLLSLFRVREGWKVRGCSVVSGESIIIKHRSYFFTLIHTYYLATQVNKKEGEHRFVWSILANWWTMFFLTYLIVNCFFYNAEQGLPWQVQFIVY